MKVWFKIFIVGMVLLASHTAFAQTTTILDRFRVSQLNGKVILEWVISSGSTCNGIRIYRSTDSVDFNLIGAILGECGSISEPVLYTFTDSLPVSNRINYYQLELGGNGSSEIVSIEIIGTDQGDYQIRPHPVNNESGIYFNNSNNSNCQLRIFNIYGFELYRASTNQNFFILQSDFLPSGLYAFTISCSSQVLKVKGTLVVQH
jgi:hypothetical protein